MSPDPLFCAEEMVDPVNISEELELPVGETGEIIVSGWHVNTFQASTQCSNKLQQITTT